MKPIYIFDLDGTNFSKNPFGPSLDRIDSQKGYTRENTRIVCCMVNTAMSEWGEEYLHILVNAMKKRVVTGTSIDSVLGGAA